MSDIKKAYKYAKWGKNVVKYGSVDLKTRYQIVRAVEQISTPRWASRSSVGEIFRDAQKSKELFKKLEFGLEEIDRGLDVIDVVIAHLVISRLDLELIHSLRMNVPADSGLAWGLQRLEHKLLLPTATALATSIINELAMGEFVGFVNKYAISEGIKVFTGLSGSAVSGYMLIAGIGYYVLSEMIPGPSIETRNKAWLSYLNAATMRNALTNYAEKIIGANEEGAKVHYASSRSTYRLLFLAFNAALERSAGYLTESLAGTTPVSDYAGRLELAKPSLTYKSFIRSCLANADTVWQTMLKDGKVTITKYDGSSAGVAGLCVDVPETIEIDGASYPVVAIGSGAFSGSDVVSVSLPDSLETIEENAFDQNSGLQLVFVPGGVKTIDPKAFGSNSDGTSNLVIVGDDNDAIDDFEESSDGGVVVDKQPKDIAPGGLALAGDSAQVRFDENGQAVLDGVKLVVTYTDGTSEVITKGFLVKPKDAQTATIIYGSEELDVSASDVVRSYTVVYQDEDGNEIAPIDIAYAPYGELVLTAPKIDGHKAISDEMRVTLSNESNEFVLVYKPSVQRLDIADATIKLSSNKVNWTGWELKPAVTVTLGGKTLKQGADYEVGYSDNVSGVEVVAEASEDEDEESTYWAHVYISGMGSYTGIVETSFQIVYDGEGDDLSSSGGARAAGGDINGFSPRLEEGDNAAFSYDYGCGIEPSISFSEYLEEGEDFEVAYYNNVNVGSGAYALVRGIGKYYGEAKLPFKIAALSIAGEQPRLAKGSVRYTGKAVKPKVTFDWSGISSSDYTLSFKNNVAIGKASVTVKGKGNFKGSKTLSFNILPAKAVVSKVKAAKRAFTVNAKAQSGAKYQFQYRLGKGKWVSRESAKATLNVKKLKSKKKYTVRVRAYAKIGSKNYYGSWSKVKSVKVK